MRSTFSRQGISLGSTLMAVAVLSLLASAVASLSVTHLRLFAHEEHSLQALNAARSTVSLAISKILQEPEFGVGRAEEHTLELEFPDAVGELTFSSAVAERKSLSYSTNNLEGTAAVQGAAGALVPSATVHLVATGRSGGSTRRVQAVLRLPPFPWAIASGGEVKTRNGVLVAALPEGVWPPPTDLSELLPADVVANGNGSEAIFLADDSVVLGDVETPGGVVLGPGQVTVRGEIRDGSSPVELPTLRPTDFDPERNGTTFFVASSSAETISGSARSAESLTFSHPLTLTQGRLFVDGNLILQRGVQGSGVLVATGDIRLSGPVDLEGNELAVISGGEVRLTGQGPGGSYLRGLFFAEQGMQVENLTLVGSLLTGHASTGVTLDRVNVLYEPPPVIEGAAGGLPEGGLDVRVIATGNSSLGTDLLLQFERLDTDPALEQPPGDAFISRGFYLDFAPTNGGYPVAVEVRPGSLPISLPPRVLESAADVEVFASELAATLDSLAYGVFVNDDSPNGNYTGSSLATAKAELQSVLTNTFANATPGAPQPHPAAGPFTDLSRFLPLEDRIRVVSWSES